MANSRHAATYLSEEQYERWQARAEEMGMSMSEFIEAMGEAGMKKFSATVEPDETNQELREQRRQLKDELDHARSRIQELEDMVYHGERRTIERYVESNPGATYDEIIQHVIDTVPGRVTTQLGDLEGEALRYEDEGYYPAKDGNGS